MGWRFHAARRGGRAFEVRFPPILKRPAGWNRQVLPEHFCTRGCATSARGCWFVLYFESVKSLFLLAKWLLRPSITRAGSLSSVVPPSVSNRWAIKLTRTSIHSSWSLALDEEFAFSLQLIGSRGVFLDRFGTDLTLIFLMAWARGFCNPLISMAKLSFFYALHPLISPQEVAIFPIGHQDRFFLFA